MNFDQQFLKDFEDWINTQVTVNQAAMEASKKVWDEDKDQRAKDAMVRYESRLDAYEFIQGKFTNYHQGKGFHDLPDGLFGEKRY